MMRWYAEITYNTNAGLLDVAHAFEELEELHDIVERGPNFYAIKQIVISPRPLAGVTGKTIEQLEAE